MLWGFHRGCTLSANLATPKKVGVTVSHVQLYLHWAFQKLLHCENIGAEIFQVQTKHECVTILVT